MPQPHLEKHPVAHHGAMVFGCPGAQQIERPIADRPTDLRRRDPNRRYRSGRYTPMGSRIRRSSLRNGGFDQSGRIAAELEQRIAGVILRAQRPGRIGRRAVQLSRRMASKNAPALQRPSAIRASKCAQLARISSVVTSGRARKASRMIAAPSAQLGQQQRAVIRRRIRSDGA